MDCKLVYNNLIGFVEDTLPAALSVEMRKHIASCELCQKLVENVAATYTVYDNVPSPEVNPFIYTRIEQKLKNKFQTQIINKPVFIWKLQPIAATILIFIGIGLGIFIGKNLSNTTAAIVTQDKNEVLNTYASEYYITGISADNIEVLLNNE